MSVVLASVSPYMAFVATDTRAFPRGPAAETFPARLRDGGAYQWRLADGTLLCDFPALGRKMRKLQNGWISAGGGSAIAIDFVYRKLKGADAQFLQDVRDAIRAGTEEALPLLEESGLDNSGAGALKNKFFLVRDTHRGFRAHSFLPDGSDQKRPPENKDNALAWYWPPDVETEVGHEMTAEFARTAQLPRCDEQAFEFLRNVARLFDAVADISEFVSHRIEIGMLVKRPDGGTVQGLVSGENPVLIHAPDEQYRLMFEGFEEGEAGRLSMMTPS